MSPGQYVHFQDQTIALQETREQGAANTKQNIFNSLILFIYKNDSFNNVAVPFNHNCFYFLLYILSAFMVLSSIF